MRASPFSEAGRPGSGQPEHGGIATGTVHRVEEELVVVLAVDPRRIRHHGQDVRPAIVRRGQRPGVVGRPGLMVTRLGHGPVIERGILTEGHRGDVRQHLTVEPVEDTQVPGLAGRRVGDPAHHRRTDLPPAADLLDAGQILGPHDGQHPLLALGRHDLVGGHARLAPGDGGDVDVHPHPTPGRRLAGRADQAGPAQILDAHDQPGVEQLQAGLDETLLLVGVADLDARPLGFIRGPRPALPAVAPLACRGPTARRGSPPAPSESGRGENADSADPVTTGGRAQQDGQVADARRLPEHQPVDGQAAPCTAR